MKIPHEAKFLLCLGLGTAISGLFQEWAHKNFAPEEQPKEGIQKIITELDDNQEALNGLSELIGDVHEAHLTGDKGSVDWTRDPDGNTKVSLQKNDGRIIRVQRNGNRARMDAGSDPVFYELKNGKWVESGLSKLNRANTPLHTKDRRSYSGNNGASL